MSRVPKKNKNKASDDISIEVSDTLEFPSKSSDNSESKIFLHDTPVDSTPRNENYGPISDKRLMDNISKGRPIKYNLPDMNIHIPKIPDWYLRIDGDKARVPNFFVRWIVRCFMGFTWVKR